MVNDEHQGVLKLDVRHVGFHWSSKILNLMVTGGQFFLGL